MITVRTIVGSPFGRAALIGCIETNAPYRLAPVTPGEHKQAAYLALHPFGRIPVIEDDGFVLYETQAILRYLDARQPGASLTPADPKTAARMNQAMSILDWYFFRPGSALTLVFNRLVAPKLGFPADTAAADAAVPTARHCVEVLAGFLADQPYFGGERMGLGDIHLGPHIDMLSEIAEGQEMLAGTPLAGWVERMRARPSFAATTWDGLAAQVAAAA